MSTLHQYKNKLVPTTVEAFQVTDSDYVETSAFPQWLLNGIIKGKIILIEKERTQFSVLTSMGRAYGHVEDWIIRKDNGELLIIPKHAFEFIYEKVM